MVGPSVKSIRFFICYRLTHHLHYSMNILTLEDHAILVLGFRYLILEIDPDAHIIPVSSFTQALAVLETTSFELMIVNMDISMEHHGEMVAKIREKQAGLPILVYTLTSEQVFAIAYFRAGANGFISKQTPLDEVKLVVTAIFHKEVYLTSYLLQLLLELNNILKTKSADRVSHLTRKQYHVMRLLSEGKTNKEIAVILDLKEATVNTHKRRIFEKLGVGSVAELSSGAGFKMINE